MTTPPSAKTEGPCSACGHPWWEHGEKGCWHVLAVEAETVHECGCKESWRAPYEAERLRSLETVGGALLAYLYATTR